MQSAGFRVQGSGFRVQVKGLAFGAWRSGFRDLDSVQGLGSKV